MTLDPNKDQAVTHMKQIYKLVNLKHSFLRFVFLIYIASVNILVYCQVTEYLWGESSSVISCSMCRVS